MAVTIHHNSHNKGNIYHNTYWFNSIVLCFLSFSVGTSDPYVKFKIAGKEVFRSKTIHKNLNPVWDERVSLLVETLRDPLYVKVQQMGPGLQTSSCCYMNCCHTLDDCSVSIDKNELYSKILLMPDIMSQCKKYVRLVTFACGVVGPLLTVCVYRLFAGFWLWLRISGWFHGLSLPPPGVTGTSEVSMSLLTSFQSAHPPPISHPSTI